jgi:flagellin-like hook-associated protein FlgL
MDKTGMNGGTDNPFVSVHANFDKLINQDNNIKALVDTGFYVNCCTNCCANHVKFVDEAGIKKDGHEISIGIKKDDGTYFTSAEEFCQAIVNSPAIAEPNHVEFACKGSTLYLFDIDNNSWDENEKQAAYFCDIPGETTTTPPTTQVPAGDVRIQMSGEVSDGMLLKIGGLSTETSKIDNCNCLTCAAAENMIAAVDLGNRLLSSQRSRIGALTNRLEHASAVNANTHENTTAAESRIRDTNMAETMVEHAKCSILEQAGQSMLAQANQIPQSVLSLLQ